MRERPTYEPGTMGAALTERGFVACWCGVSMKRASGPWACGRKGCDKNGRVDPYGAGPDCRSGGSSPAGSEPATATIKPRAGKAAEDALAAALVGAGFEVVTYGAWLKVAIGAEPFVGFVREFNVGAMLAEPRRFRCDFLHIPARLVVEVEGGCHGIQKQRRSDIVREQLLTSAGLRVVRVLPEQVHNGEALALVRRAVEGQE